MLHDAISALLIAGCVFTGIFCIAFFLNLALTAILGMEESYKTRLNEFEKRRKPEC